jgi:hypothetical protein
MAVAVDEIVIIVKIDKVTQNDRLSQTIPLAQFFLRQFLGLLFLWSKYLKINRAVYMLT